LIVAGLLAGVWAVPAAAVETVGVIRSGYFTEITDGESDGFYVRSLRMSADGTKIVYLTSEFPYGHDTLRIINADGSGDAVIYANSDDTEYDLTDAFDISDDGSLVVFTVWITGTSWNGEIWVYDTESESTSTLLTNVPHTSYGVPSNPGIEPQAGFTTLRMTGDGTTLFFLNRWGPQGGNNDGFPVSGFTVYQVTIPAGEPTPVFSQADIPNVPGVSASAVSLMSADGTLATDYTGSVLLLPVGGSGASGVLPHHLLTIDPSQGASSARIVLNLTNTIFHGPSVSGNGVTMVFSRFAGDAPEPTGLLAMNADGSGAPVLLDPGTPAAGRYPTFPVISKNGGLSAHNFDIGGGSDPSIRTAPTDGSGPLPVSLNTVDANGHISDISADGSRIALIGAVNPDAGAQHANVVVFNWASSGGIPSGTPAVTGITADPEVELIKQPGLHAETTTTYTYTTSGANLGIMYSFSYDDTAASRDGTGTVGMGVFWGQLPDDGLNGDEVAGDGIFNDTGIWALTNLVGDLTAFTGRGAITSYDNTASFVDFVIPVRDPVAPTASFTSTPTTGAAPLEVTFVNTSTGDWAVEHWDLNGDGYFDTWDPDPPVTFTFSEPGEYTPGLKVTGYGNESAIETTTITVLEPSDLSVSTNMLTLTVTSPSATVDILNTGEAELSWSIESDNAAVTVDPESGTGEATVTVSTSDFTEDATANLTFTNTDDESDTEIVVIHIERANPADISGDGVVNAVDVQLVINAALGIDIGGRDADVNGDGTVNALDVQLAINAALGIEI